MARDQKASESFSAVEAKTASTPEGRAILTARNQEVARDQKASESFSAVEATTASTPEGRAILTTRNHEVARDSKASVSYLAVEACTASTPEGRATLTTRNNAVATDSKASASQLSLQNSATTLPEGKAALQSLLQATARSPEVSRTVGAVRAAQPNPPQLETRSIQETAKASAARLPGQASGGLDFKNPSSLLVDGASLRRPEGLVSFRERAVTVAQSVPASTQAVQSLAQAVTTPEGRTASSKLLSSLSRDAGASVAFVQVQAQASKSPQGLSALGLLNQGIGRDSRLALAVAQVHAQAAAMGPGRLAIGQLTQNLPVSGALKQPAQVVDSNEGRAALTRMNLGLTLDPAVAAQVQSVRNRARLEDQDSHSKIEAAAQKDPALANSMRQMESAARRGVITPTPPQPKPVPADPLESEHSVAEAGSVEAQAKSVPVVAVSQAATPEGLPGSEPVESTPISAGPAKIKEMTSSERVFDYKETLAGDVKDEPSEKIEEVSKPRARSRVTENEPVSKTNNLEEVQPVTLFEPGDRTGHNCRRCGTDFQARVACCPSCQNELRQILATSSTSFQRAGYVVSRQSDRVEVTQSALQALGEESQFVHMRGAAVFVQMKDLLAACQQKVTGYATFAPRKPSRPNLD